VTIQFSIPVSLLWFAAILDKGVNSLRDLFYQLNPTGTSVKLSTFSQANKTRDPQIMRHLYHKLLRYIEQFHPQRKLVLCPFDATVIPLMSKLFWLQGYRQLKLITTLHQDTVFSFIMGYSSNIWQTNLQKKKD
jgi:putative transposase